MKSTRILAAIAVLQLLLSPIGAAASTLTPNLNLEKPSVGADADAWGSMVDANYDLVDAEYARVTGGDSGTTLTSAMRYVALTAALTAPRTWTLPAASSMKTAQPIAIIDEVGGITSTNTLTITPAGSDTINGASSFVLSTGRQVVILRSDGTSKWTVQGGSPISSSTWSPVLDFATHGNLNVVYSTQSGTVLKIGGTASALCYATFNIVTSTFSFTTASGIFEITGLTPSPISATATQAAGELGAGNIGLTSTDRPYVVVGANAILQLVSWSAGSFLTNTNFATGTNVTLRGYISYRC